MLHVLYLFLFDKTSNLGFYNCPVLFITRNFTIHVVLSIQFQNPIHKFVKQRAKRIHISN